MSLQEVENANGVILRSSAAVIISYTHWRNNVTSIIFWVRPYEPDEGTMIYVTAQGNNDYPVSLCVKESYSQVKKLING